uniref:Hybrid-cluster protein n=1 Tax=Yamagishiella unicocca TaxID=51707 RepID=A0A1W6R6J8_9CHLO|nr:hybrid-cluster protein [Yamagishiella unicocca]
MLSRCLTSVGSRLSSHFSSGTSLSMLCVGPTGRRSLAPRILAYLPCSTAEGPSCQQIRDASSIRAKMDAANEALKSDKMMCYQCEQTKGGTGCTEIGVCGKTPEVATLQDLLIYSVKGLASLAHHARTAAGIEDAKVNTFINGAIFSTLTNVNFADDRFVDFVTESRQLHAQLSAKLAAAGVALPASASEVQPWFGSMPHPLTWNSQAVALGGVGDMLEIGEQTGIGARQVALGETLAGLQELLMYGLKGLAAYAHHAEALGHTDPKVYADVQASLHFLCSPAAADVGQVLDQCFKAGATNFRVMEMLSNAHTSTFGHPVPTSVTLNPVPGKAILVTGHDMHDLHMMLEQTAGKGINVYTHGEMLPGHGYPGLKKYPHLVGHFGGAWYRQKIDFAGFPGAIAVTTNCVLDPLQAYKGNIYTINETGLSGVPHIKADATGHKDFTPIINRALELPGFTAESVEKMPKKKNVTVGFGHNAVLSVAPQVIDAIQTGRLEHIFLVGGCDGSEPQRKYYSKLYQYMPTNTMVLTLGCGKFRIFDQDFGNLPGTDIPRLLDMGQCNDAYSALVVATELAKVFKTDVNSLPLSLDLSWFEQKAVAVLLSLLHLGVRNIRLGPRLPAFLTPEAVGVLVERFNLIPANVSDPGADMKMMMQCK